MARVWDSEVLNCPHVNQSINAEHSHISSALIDPEIRAEFGKRQPRRAGLNRDGGEGWQAVGICRGASSFLLPRPARQVTVPPGVWED